MNGIDVLLDGLGRIRETVHATVQGLPAERLNERLTGGANSIAWLIWHLTRVQDDHVSEVAERAQVWTSGGWSDRFGLDLDPASTGYGHTEAEAAAVRVRSPDQLLGYYDAVHQQTLEFLSRVTDADLDRIVDRNWDPPVTLGGRLVSVIDDDAQHVGQAAFVRGLLDQG
jgi:uncharacterized damage-inducible protein DinB